MSRMKLAILDDYQGVALEMADWKSLSDRCEITVFRDTITDPKALIQRLSPFEIIVVMRERTPLPRTILEALPILRLIASNSAKNASIDVAAANELGIAVSHTGYHMHGTPELAWGLILAATRHIPQEVAALRSGGWQQHVGQGIHGRTLGILGLGNHGKIVARIGQAFDMNVIAWSANLDAAAARALQVEPVTKEQLFSRADILCIHMVLSDRSRHVVGRQDLAQMKPTAWLINTSRGPLVDEDALIEALTRRQIAGAALDVFDREPLPQDHPFRTLPNVIATPHIGYVTDDMYRLFYGNQVECINAWLDGKPLRTDSPTRPR